MFLHRSLALWKRRLAYRRRRFYAAKRKDDVRRMGKWRPLVAHARMMVERRERQIAARNPAVQHTSRRGVEFIKGFEGFVSHPYRDAVGVWTIGYGHTAGVTSKSRPLSVEQATVLLATDLEKHYEPPVTARGLKLTQGQFDALVSIVYNCGPGILAPNRSLGGALARRDMRAAADAFLLYDKAGGQRLPGLTRRRIAERRTFLGG